MILWFSTAHGALLYKDYGFSNGSQGILRL